MKRKIWHWGFLGALLFMASYLVYRLYLEPNSNLQPIYLIPKDAVFILESNTPVESWETISQSEAWEHLQKNAYFDHISEGVQRLDTLFRSQRKLFNWLDDRDLFISIHPMPGQNDYGVFYVLDLKKLAKINLLKTYLNTLLNDGYTLSKRNYHRHEILEVFDKIQKQTLYLSFIKNQLVASYTHTLIEASIDQYAEPYIGRNYQFIAVNQKVYRQNEFRFYVQYDYLKDYAGLFFTADASLVNLLTDNLDFSGFSLSLEDERLEAKGFTNLPKQQGIFFEALKKSGFSKTEIFKITPNNAALVLRVGYKDFSTFYEHFESLFKITDSEAFDQFAQQKSKVETLLDIDFKEHFFSWVGDEIGIIYLNEEALPKEMLVAIKMKNQEETKEKMDFVLEQIRKKTPGKFKKVTHRGFPIHFLDIKGFFNLFFAKKFAQLDKPYFTYIGDYLILSNSPNQLRAVINSYQKKEVLLTNKDFKIFFEGLDSYNSIMVYGHTPLFLQHIKNKATPKAKKSLTDNEDFIICFPHIAMSLKPDEELFKTQLLVQFENPEKVKSKIAPLLLKGNMPVVSMRQTQDPFDIPPIYPNDLSAKEYIYKTESGRILYEVKLKDGLKHGIYNSYHHNGKIKITGRFKNDKKVGLWRQYDTKGKLIFKKRF